MSTTTYHVTLFRRWVSAKGSGRWTTGHLVSDFLPQPTPQDIATFAVDAVSKTEAIPVLLEWLARGRPRDMTVREVPR